MFVLNAIVSNQYILESFLHQYSLEPIHMKKRDSFSWKAFYSLLSMEVSVIVKLYLSNFLCTLNSILLLKFHSMVNIYIPTYLHNVYCTVIAHCNVLYGTFCMIVIVF